MIEFIDLILKIEVFIFTFILTLIELAIISIQISIDLWTSYTAAVIHYRNPLFNPRLLQHLHHLGPLNTLSIAS